MILCFRECFSAIMCCRFCYMTRDRLRMMTIEDPGLLRGEPEYRRDVETCDNGVNGPSVRSEEEGFHPLKNPCCDLMHDLDEGVAVYDMQHILFDLISFRGYFVVETLNSALVTFNFCPDVTNRPVQLSDSRIRNKNIQHDCCGNAHFCANLLLSSRRSCPRR